MGTRSRNEYGLSVFSYLLVSEPFMKVYYNITVNRNGEDNGFYILCQKKKQLGKTWHVLNSIFMRTACAK